ncbi:MAG TPA: sigma-54 dependent transcriptional regulator [Pyrinomonadaceae bacterium]
MSFTLIGRSPAHRELLEKISKIAPTDAEVIISGPSGVGKELYARHIHRCSERRQAAFVPVNCGALPTDLFENEFFGHVGGAFTGARAQSEGLVAEAENGTLFLDEIDSLSPASQVKLLRYLEDGEYRRLGETRIRRSHVRVVAATNADLGAAMREGRFREDLFFRLRVVPIEVPPLRERREDIPLLLASFVSCYARLYGLPRIVFSPEATRALTTYDWPGNIRELKNCVRYLTCLRLESPVRPHDLSLLGNAPERPPAAAAAANTCASERTMKEAKRELVTRFEREYLEAALRQSNGNIAQAARASGKPRRAFFELMRKYGIKPDAACAEADEFLTESFDP